MTGWWFANSSFLTSGLEAEARVDQFQFVLTVFSDSPRYYETITHQTENVIIPSFIKLFLVEGKHWIKNEVTCMKDGLQWDSFKNKPFRIAPFLYPSSKMTETSESPALGLKRKVINKVKGLSIWKQEKELKEEGSDGLWSMLCSAESSLDECNRWLEESKKNIDDDVINFKLFDLQAIVDKRSELEDLHNKIELEESKINKISEIFQRFCQMIPPSELRIEKKSAVSETRRKFAEIRLKVAEQREKFRVIIPILCHYSEFSVKIKMWLDEAESKSINYINKYDDDIILLENSNDIESMLLEVLEQKPIYEEYLTYGETALDNALMPFDDLKIDVEQVTDRWDTLCIKLQKCADRLEIAKKIEEENQKNEAERIESQLRREAHKCNCCKPFEIVRIGEGKYTFGNSKIVRLVRIHGSSVVVRVGGGWEYLLNFLMRCDPCRAKDLADGIESFKKLGMKPVDERRHSYAFETRKVYGAGPHLFPGEYALSHKHFSHTCDASFDAELSSSADSLDACSLGSDAGHTHTCNEKLHQRPKTATHGTPKRKTSASSLSRTPEVSTRPKSTTPNSRSRPTRKSLVERQTDFSERMKTSSLQRTSSPKMMSANGI